MERTRWKSLVTGLVTAVALGATVTGCASGYGATSRQDYAPADGVLAESGDIRALNVLVVAAEGTSTGLLVMTLANDGETDDRLTGIETSSGTVALSGDPALPAGGAVTFSNDGDATATVGDLTAAPGEQIELTLTFTDAEPITLRTVVVPATREYEGLTPSATPSG